MRNCLLLGLLALVSASLAQSGTLYVDAKSNVFGYGEGAPEPGGGGGGLVAPSIVLGPGTGRTITFSATGQAGWGGQLYNGPDGGDFATWTAINSYGPISGYTGPESGHLLGLFLPADDFSALPAPSAYGYMNLGDYAMESYSPELRQLFFIGDGLTGKGIGTTQSFAVPDGASRLVLGIADAFAFSGNPGWYADNVGGYDVRYEAVPEPATLLSLAAGMALIVRRRRSRKSS